ncbi:MAG TPA: SPFH domain-containing protein [Pseudonocardia sp.]
MISLIILIVITLLGIGGSLIAAAPVRGERPHIGRGVAVMALVAVIWFGFSITTVGTNEQSVRTAFGKPTGTVLDSGMHLVAPWSSGATFSSANQYIQFIGDGSGGEDGSDEPKIKVRLARQATAEVEGIVYYQQPADHVTDLFLGWKKEERIRSKFVLPEFQQALNEAFGTYDPLKELEQEKDALARNSQAATESLQRRVGDKLSGIKVMLTNIDYDDNTEKQITDLQAALARTRVATQDALTAEQVAAANRTISASLKGDSTTAYYRCIEMVTKTLAELKPQSVDISAVCAMAVGVLK